MLVSQFDLALTASLTPPDFESCRYCVGGAIR